jgi:hypothetical protein
MRRIPRPARFIYTKPMADPAIPQMPSAKGLLARLLISAVVGGIIVMGAVLPAEFHLDPTGFGRISGLLALSGPAGPPVVNKAPEADPATGPEPKLPKNAWFFPGEFRSDTIKIPLKPDGELEYKVQMKPGGVLVYSWETDQGMAYYDFHGEPTNDPKNATRYREEQEVKNSHGGFVAPFEGIHGWYWLNLTGKTQVITLKMSGYYQLHDMK